MAAENCVQGHSVLIYDRGGRRRVSELVNLQKIEWGRVLSGKSLATITINAKNCAAQMSRIRRLAPKRHEVVIFRGDLRVWEGSLLDLGWFSNRLEVYVTDCKAYLDARLLTQAWPLSTGTPVSESSSLMTERAKVILQHELATDYVVQTNAGPVTIPAWDGPTLDPKANILPHLDVRDSTTLLTRSSTTPFQMSVGQHLDNLAEGRLAYTFVGRSLLIWDSAQSIGTTRILTENDFYGELKVYDSGGDYAAIAHLATTETDGENPPAIGHAGASDPFYGPWAFSGTLEQEDGASQTPLVQSDLNTQAERRLIGKSPIPTQIVIPDGGGIRLTRDLTINHLIPGAVMPVRATMNLKPVQQDQRLTEMNVSEDASGETVTVKLSPAGTLQAVG